MGRSHPAPFLLVVVAVATLLGAGGLTTLAQHATPTPGPHGDHQPTPQATATGHHGRPTPVATGAAQTAVRIVVDGTRRYQTFAGFGGALSIFEDNTYQRHDPTQPARVSASQADRAGIAALLYTQLGLTRARIFLEGFEPSPGTFDWSSTDPEIGFVATARDAGLTTWWTTFSIWSEAETWLRTPGPVCSLDPAQRDAFVEWLVAAERHLRDRGLASPYMAVVNEPDLAPNCGDATPVITVDDMVVIVRRLGARLREEGLPTKIVVADGWTPERALPYMAAVLADREARQYVGALAYHAYSGPYGNASATLRTSAQGNPDPAAVAIRERIRDLAARYNLPVWMTEVCVCVPQGDNLDAFEMGRARLNHFFDELTYANIAAIDVMQLFFIERPGVSDELVHVAFRPDGALDHYEVAPYGYLVGQLARSVPDGSVRLDATSSDARVRVVAFARPDGRVAVAVINNSDAAAEATIGLGGTAGTPSAVAMLTSTAGDLWRSGPPPAVEGGSVRVALPARSVTTLVTSPPGAPG